MLNIEQLYAQDNNYCNSLNSYSFDLYREIKVEQENLFLSPLSTYYALLVAYEGARSKTKQEFEKVLHLKNPDSFEFEFLASIANKPDNNSGLQIANSTWLDKTLNLEEQYKKSLSNKYFSDFRQTEFANTELAVSDINRWVSEKTNHRITELLNNTDINASTKFVISNAVYFKEEWLNKFDKQKTFSAPFFTSSENQYKVDFMNKVEKLSYFENDEYQFISKPYKNSDLSFCIILPKKLFGIQEIEEKMNTDFLKEILDNAHSTKTSLSIPKLKFESCYEMSDVLQTAGLKNAFTSEADFSGITKDAPLQLSRVVHKACIELDEEKTEAAATTAAVMRITGLPSYKIFKADHPFVFFVIHNRSRALLFMGRYIKPANAENIEQASLTSNLEKRKKEKFAIGNAGKGILFLIDNKIISQSEFQTINPEAIESMEILKDNEDIEKYSSKDYDGVVVITLKKERKNQRKNR
uniref:serpin family protein n=1 Tax=uncultured Draconibacterium sp. TaxID=1573823 RepID=UPI003217957D